MSPDIPCLYHSGGKLTKENDKKCHGLAKVIEVAVKGIDPNLNLKNVTLIIFAGSEKTFYTKIARDGRHGRKKAYGHIALKRIL